jgi:DNA repair protein RadC
MKRDGPAWPAGLCPQLNKRGTLQRGRWLSSGMLLKDLPHAARPREKLLSRGAGALSDAELLALLLRSGIPGKNVLMLAQELVDRFGGVAGLLHTPAEELKSIKGLGPAKRAELVAVLELSRRALAQQLKQKPLFNTPQAVRDYLQLQLGARSYEVFAVLFLDSQHRLIELEEMFRGTLTQTSVYPREVVKRALTLHASSVVLAHNHPSGTAQPSRADELLTQTLKAALALIDVRVLDHFVVTGQQAVSMAELGLV